MQNTKQKNLIIFLSKECGLNKFSVIDKKDILSSFDKKFFVDENELDSLITALERQGYIKIKYEDDNVYCLSVLREPEKETKKEKEIIFPFSLYIVCLLFSFIGSFLGSIIAQLLK